MFVIYYEKSCVRYKRTVFVELYATFLLIKKLKYNSSVNMVNKFLCQVIENVLEIRFLNVCDSGGDVIKTFLKGVWGSGVGSEEFTS